MIFRAHGRFVESLGGRYVTAEDVGTSTATWTTCTWRRTTSPASPTPPGDPSPVTARGVFRAIQASAKQVGLESLEGKTVRCRGWATWATTSAASCTPVGAKLEGDRHRRPKRVKRVVEECGATAVDLDAIYAVGGRHLRALRARWHHQRRHHPASSRWRSSPARPTISCSRRSTAPRWRSAASSTRRTTWPTPAASSTCTRAGRLDARARAAQGRRDLRHHARRVRDRQGAGDDHVRGGGPLGRAAHRRPWVGWSAPGPRGPRKGGKTDGYERIPIASDHAGYELKQKLVTRAGRVGLRRARTSGRFAGLHGLPRLCAPVAARVESRRGRSAACCSAAPGSACRTPPTGTRRARRGGVDAGDRQAGARTTMPTCWCCRRAS
jgi:hypothetical protein